MVEFDFISFDEFNSPYYHVPENKFKVQNWYYNYHEKSDYSEEQLLVFYVPKGIINKPMQEKYSRMVQYSECLVDTTAQIFFKTPDPLEDIYLDDSDSGHKILDFTSYMNEKTNKPKSSDYNLEDVDGYELYDLDLEKWRGDWITKTKIFNEDKKAQLMFKEALDVATLTMLGTSDEFENYVLHFDSPEKALFLKRSRRVVGRCSMDSSPRYHALTIAELAGETATWEIFLRAHLDIMNDRFDRVSDGSYAQAQRQTYIKELEELNINLPDLLLGICLRVENSSQNHYYGDIGRIGRALSESEDKLAFEQTMLGMIKDEKLDDYNRMLMYYLFTNYNHYTKEENLKELNNNRLREAVATLPNYLKNNIKI